MADKIVDAEEDSRLNIRGRSPGWALVMLALAALATLVAAMLTLLLGPYPPGVSSDT